MADATGKRCCKRVFRPGGSYGGSPCRRASTVERDGNPYCTQHDPEVEKSRRAELAAKWDRKFAAERAARERQAARAELERAAGLPYLTDDELRAAVAAGGIRAMVAAATGKDTERTVQ